MPDTMTALKSTVTPTPQSITLIGRRWFNSSQGNTYHAADILVNGELVHSTGIHYGYGSHWAEGTCNAWLRGNGFLPSDDNKQALWASCKDLGITLHESVIDVSRKKDL